MGMMMVWPTFCLHLLVKKFQLFNAYFLLLLLFLLLSCVKRTTIWQENKIQYKEDRQIQSQCSKLAAASIFFPSFFSNK